MYQFKSFLLTQLVILASFAGISTASFAENSGPFEVGFSFDPGLGDGTPANDILGASLSGSYKFNNGWLLGLTLTQASYDFETPYRDLGISSTEIVDATADSALITAWVEKRYNEQRSGGHWYWKAGLGINSIDVTNISGTTTGSQPFAITTEVDDETVIMVEAGRRQTFGQRWALHYGLSYELHQGDWRVTDTESNISDVTIDSYDVIGLSLGVNYQF